MFWKTFYWLLSFIYSGCGAAVLFGWKPDPQTVAWAAFFGVSIAAQSIARQED